MLVVEAIAADAATAVIAAFRVLTRRLANTNPRDARFLLAARAAHAAATIVAAFKLTATGSTPTPDVATIAPLLHIRGWGLVMAIRPAAATDNSQNKAQQNHTQTSLHLHVPLIAQKC